MIFATVIGNLGRDAEIKDVTGGAVVKFNVASSAKSKGQDVTTWVGCSYFGKRATSVAPYLLKGKQVAVSGQLTTRLHEGKTYVDLHVAELQLIGPRDAGSGGSQRSAPSKSSGGYSDEDYGARPSDDDIPF